MAKARKGATRKSKRLTGSQVSRLQELFKRAMLDAAFRRQLLSNPGRVLERYGIGLSAAQLRQLNQAKKALLKKARELEKNAVKAAQRISTQAKIIGWPTIN